MKIPSIPPHFMDEKKKEVILHIKVGLPVTMAIATWMESFLADYKCVVVIRCEKTFYQFSKVAIV